MRIYHLALLSDWDAARASGSYTTSTLGVTLEEEGYLHASRAEQWEGVRARFYAGVTEPLVLLVIDTDLLGVPVVEEIPAPGMTETFPHIYGPLDPAAVVEVVPLGGGVIAAAAPYAGPAEVPPPASFSRVFLGEMALNVGLALLVMVLVAVGILLGRGLDDTWGPWLGLVVGLAVGVPLAVALHRRRS